MKPLRVVFLASCFPRPGREGLGVWALKQAAALQRQGAEVTVISLTSWVPRILRGLNHRIKAWADCPDECEMDGVRVIYPKWLLYQIGPLKRWDFRRPWFQHMVGWLSVRRRLLRMIERLKPDVIYAHHTWVSGDVAWRLHRLYGIPYVVTDHDFEEVAECKGLPKRRQFFEKVISGAACMMPVARKMQRDLLDMVPDARTDANPNGADPIPTQLNSTARPVELDGKIVVLCVASFFPRKNLQGLIRVFDRAAKKHPRAVLRIIGDGDRDVATIRETARQAANADRIALLGRLPHPRVMQEMAWCDVFALIGWDEPFATVYVEAMSVGKPILCCSDGGITDVLIDGIHGLTIPPRDEDAATAALDYLLGDEPLRARLGAAGKQLYESHLTWDHNAQRLIKVLLQAAFERPQELASSGKSLQAVE